jgi:hypothetical protein
VLKDKLDPNLVLDFSQTMHDSDYFAPDILVVEFYLIYSGYKSSKWVELPNSYLRERCILNNHWTHRFSEQLCSEHHKNLGRARIDKNKNDVELATDEND